MLTCQGFPIDVRHTHGIICSSYALRHWREMRNLPFDPWPSRHALCEHAGDSMHTSVSGIVFLFALTQIMISPEMVRLQRWVLLRNQRLQGAVDPVPKAPQLRSQLRALGDSDDEELDAAKRQRTS